MSAPVILIGALMAPEMQALLGQGAGRVVSLRGWRLIGGARGGWDGDWPILQPAPDEELPGVEITGGPALARWLDITGLPVLDCQGQPVIGAYQLDARASAATDGPGQAVSAEDTALLAQLSRDMLAVPETRPAAKIRARLPLMAHIAASRLRAGGGGRVSSLLPPPETAGLRIHAHREPYSEFFAIEEYDMSHRLSDGGQSAQMRRAVFVSGDASVVLPWDPKRDRVLLIDQLRLGPMARGQEQLWLLEPVAGRVDAGESPEEAARRECLEEAGLEIGELIPLPHFYPTPGANSEVFYCFIALADLPDEAVGRGGGLETEGEDIRSHLVSRQELARMLLDGELQCGPLLLLSLWLDRLAASRGHSAG